MNPLARIFFYLLSGLFGAFIGLLTGIWLGEQLAAMNNVSDFEGGSGIYVVSIALLTSFVFFIAGVLLYHVLGSR